MSPRGPCYLHVYSNLLKAQRQYVSMKWRLLSGSGNVAYLSPDASGSSEASEHLNIRDGAQWHLGGLGFGSAAAVDTICALGRTVVPPVLVKQGLHILRSNFSLC